MSDISEYLDVFHVLKAIDNIGEMELKNILFNSTPNGRSKKAYVQSFDCETINFEKSINMFECMEIAETIYEVVLERSHKKYYIKFCPCWLQ